MRSARGVEPTGIAGDGRRTLQRRGLHHRRDFARYGPGSRGALAFRLTPIGIFGCGLVELPSVSVDVGSIGGVGGET